MDEPPVEEMRQVYARVLLELHREAPGSIHALEADLSSSMGTAGLAGELGDSFVNVGIMEAHMVSMAAGLNIVGGYPFVHSFGQFLARRAMDQIFVSLAYSGLSACLVGSDAGVSAEHNGGTHMTFEDMGIVRCVPGVEVYDVCEPAQFEAVLRQARRRGGLTYVRTFRKRPRLVPHAPGTRFAGRGAIELRCDGDDVALLACGLEVAEALAAADLLAAEGIRARVLDVYRVQPLDERPILVAARAAGAVVTAENHSARNGLGSAVAELLAERAPTPMRRVGVRDAFGQVGTTGHLLGVYGLDAAAIAEAARGVVARKRRGGGAGE